MQSNITTFFGSIDWNFMSDLTGGGVREDRVVSAKGALVRGGGS